MVLRGVCGTELEYGATSAIACTIGMRSRDHNQVLYWHRVCCYAVCSTSIAYAAMQCPVYAVCGSELGYGASRQAVLSWSMVLADK
eukprot:3941415-Rhodomonas_salina.1